MKVALFCALILIVSTPSRAAASCFNMAQARQHFGSVHIYWHGADHCWDASPGSRAHHSVRKFVTVAARPASPKWRNAFSEMVTEPKAASEPETPAAQVSQIILQDRPADIGSSEPTPASRLADVPRAMPPPVESTTPHPDKFALENFKFEGVMFLLLGFALLVIVLPLSMIIARPEGVSDGR
jgi:hypothetical protein